MTITVKKDSAWDVSQDERKSIIHSLALMHNCADNDIGIMKLYISKNNEIITQEIGDTSIIRYKPSPNEKCLFISFRIWNIGQYSSLYIEEYIIPLTSNISNYYIIGNGHHYNTEKKEKWMIDFVKKLKMDGNYKILPFRFARFNESEYLLTNDVGEYVFLSNECFEKFINKELDTKSTLFQDIASKQIATTDNVEDLVKMLATKFRTKKSILRDFTSLHMVVPTLRCNSSCIYCQVARKNMNDHEADMTKRTAKNVVKTIFQSPSPCIKIEFQGGDPSTDFQMVKYIIEEAEWQNLFKKKDLSFVICTNLTLLTPNMVKYLKKHKCDISTSLDGPKELHNTNRPLQDTTHTYEKFDENIKMIREICGPDSVSALMTTSKYSLGHFKEIIDEYVRMGYNNIFLRALNPYGFAKQYKKKIAYPVEDFIENFKEGLDYIIELNKQGIFFIEGYAALLLKRILTPFATGFVDLQSPAGVGIAGAIYDWDGNVYVADEGRMLARFKDYYFKLGNVNEDSYQSMFNGDKLHHIIENACTECLPMCSECVFQPYCGADPVRNYSEQGDMIGHRPTSDMCKKNTAIMHYLFELLKKHDPEINRIFWSWIN